MKETNTDSGASAILTNNRQSLTDSEHDRSMSEEYKKGFIEGIKKFAWQGGDVTYVGTDGMTLEEAYAEIESEYRQKRPDISMKA